MKLQIATCQPVNVSGHGSTIGVRKKKKNPKVRVKKYALVPLGSFASETDGDEVFGVPSCCFDHV
ncbi:MAG TPA: hypothetical protein VIR29_03820 [Anseongella sp.]